MPRIVCSGCEKYLAVIGVAKVTGQFFLDATCADCHKEEQNWFLDQINDQRKNELAFQQFVKNNPL